MVFPLSRSGFGKSSAEHTQIKRYVDRLSPSSLCIVGCVDTGNQLYADVREGALHSGPRGEKDGAVLNERKTRVRNHKIHYGSLM